MRVWRGAVRCRQPGPHPSADPLTRADRWCRCLRNWRDGRCSSWLARWGGLRLFEWLPRLGKGRAMVQGGAMEAEVRWPAESGTPGLYTQILFGLVCGSGCDGRRFAGVAS